MLTYDRSKKQRYPGLSRIFFKVGLPILCITLLSACSKTQLEEPTQSTQFKSSQSKPSKDLGKAFIKKPQDAVNTLHYAQYLITADRPKKAFQVLETGLRYNPKNEYLLSEYGRLAIKLDRFSLAQKTLDKIEDSKDWRVFSAKGALAAQNAKHEKAQGYFIKALDLQPNEPSLLNNLAMSYALTGQPAKAEGLLRRVIKQGEATDKIKQNLALVLSLQGKFKDAKTVATTVMPETSAQGDINYFRKFVQKPILSQSKTSQQNIILPASYKTPNKEPEKKQKQAADVSSSVVDELRGQQQ